MYPNPNCGNHSDCLKENKKYTYSFYEIFERFTEIYWVLVLKLNLAQGTSPQKTHIEQILNSISVEYPELKTTFHNLNILTSHQKNTLIKKVVKKCKIYVVGALYSDTNGLFYSFSKKDEFIKINPLMYNFIAKHTLAIEELNYYELAKFLATVNDGADLVDNTTSNDMVQKYRQTIYNEIENLSFSTNVPINLNSVELLIDAENHCNNFNDAIKSSKYNYENCISEEEISCMSKYLDDPARIIKMIATRKNILF